MGLKYSLGNRLKSERLVSAAKQKLRYVHHACPVALSAQPDSEC